MKALTGLRQIPNSDSPQEVIKRRFYTLLYVSLYLLFIVHNYSPKVAGKASHVLSTVVDKLVSELFKTWWYPGRTVSLRHVTLSARLVWRNFSLRTVNS